MFNELKNMRSDVDHLIASDMQRNERDHHQLLSNTTHDHEVFPSLPTSSEADIYPGKKQQQLSNAFSAIVKNGIPAPQKQPIKQSTGQIKHVVGGSVTNQRLKSTSVTRPVDIFVSRLEPETTETDVLACAYDVLDKEDDGSVTCVKLQTKFQSYSSFHVSILVDSTQMKRTIEQVMSTEAWPQRLLVRRYFKTKNGQRQT